MEKKIKVGDLKVGMYVILPTSWFSHPFLKNSFNIVSEEEIKTIIKCGLKEVLIDPSLEKLVREEPRAESEVPLQGETGAGRPRAVHEQQRPSPARAEAAPDAEGLPGTGGRAVSSSSVAGSAGHGVKPQGRVRREEKKGTKPSAARTGTAPDAKGLPVTAIPASSAGGNAGSVMNLEGRVLREEKAGTEQPPAVRVEKQPASAPRGTVPEAKDIPREPAGSEPAAPLKTAGQEVPPAPATAGAMVIMRGNEEVVIPRSWEPDKLVPAQLREAINDKRLAPEKKAEVVYVSSLQIMDRVLLEPTRENIEEMKSGIAEVVDLIIADDDTSKHLLSITTHDYYTYTHSVRVGVFSVMLAKALYKDSDGHDLHELGAGFFLHDIGKVRINPDIINKPGKLTDAEWQEMRTHPYLGYKLLSETDQLTRESKIIVLQHHEWKNGKGYPNRLAGTEIHDYARICSVADVYDAITSDRPYKQKKTAFEALQIMKGEMEDHFGKDLFERFIMLLL